MKAATATMVALICACSGGASGGQGGGSARGGGSQTGGGSAAGGGSGAGGGSAIGGGSAAGGGGAMAGDGGLGNVGDACSAPDQCAGQVCLTLSTGGSAQFPGGYCSQRCTSGNDATCPQGSVCIDATYSAAAGMFCLRSCDAMNPCRQGYGCFPNYQGASTPVCVFLPP